VSRQIEAHVYDYFGWDPYWGGSFLPMSNAMATPFVAPLYEQESTPPDLARADAQPNEGGRQNDGASAAALRTSVFCAPSYANNESIGRW
jgi:hypothetical protein